MLLSNRCTPPQLHKPRPDGFGPLFFKHSWAVVTPDICALFSPFHAHTLDLERINRSYLVLLPKKEGA
jgi:hypothetical protein